jgi:hypothetical protein
MSKRLLLLATAAAVAVALLAIGAGTVGADSTRTYEVTITNRTGGQPLTPPAVATHRKQADVFEVGDPASTGIKEIAENGYLTPLLAALGTDSGVFEAFAAPGGPLVPVGTPGSAMFDELTTFMIDGGPGSKYFSYVSMLICTNDGFTGVDSLRLPKNVGDTVSVDSDAYDAGTESNTEYFGDIVPPCQGLIGVTGDPGTGESNPMLAEGGVITHHGGIVGGVEDLLPGTHGWTDPVATITIERVG